MDNQGLYGFLIMEGWGNVNLQLPNYKVGSCTVFDRTRDKNFTDASTVYHDRMRQWDDKKYTKACEEAGVRQEIFGATLEQMDVLLTSYFGYPCRVFFVEVQRGYNGYDCVRMDYQYNKENSST